jgi:hypothetical protein
MRNVVVEILVEELSMKNFLTVLLPRILPNGYRLNENCFIRAHEGKQDLQKSIPRKIRAFNQSKIPYKVIVLHDQDSADCRVLKQKLKQLVLDNAPIPMLIRIVCRELEAWYLGDMEAISKVYPAFKVDKYRNLTVFRKPDICNAADELKKRIPTFQKGYASKEIPKHFNLSQNSSESFNQFVLGLKHFLG